VTDTSPNPIVTTIIDGASVARRIRAAVQDAVAHDTAAGERPPGLATILVGDDPASHVYVENKRRTARTLGIRDEHRALPATATQDEVAAVIDELAADDTVSGILLQLPLPPSLDADALLDRIPPEKDVDGLSTPSTGLLARNLPGLRPCTPSGVMRLLDDAGVDPAGKQAVVVGASHLVGLPMAQMLLNRDATVTTAHRRTSDLLAVTRTAEILVVAAGVPKLITRQHLTPGVTIIDVGINRTETGLVGDVDFEGAMGVARHITPVPGGVGPMTIAMLLENTLTAHRNQRAANAHRTNQGASA
jgi:methylenetetrahydrofolate dehydrogenase (NADP+)/methenyltetrahydrofolate cyclohydrolase